MGKKINIPKHVKSAIEASYKEPKTYAYVEILNLKGTDHEEQIISFIKDLTSVEDIRLVEDNTDNMIFRFIVVGEYKVEFKK